MATVGVKGLIANYWCKSHQNSYHYHSDLFKNTESKVH